VFAQPADLAWVVADTTADVEDVAVTAMVWVEKMACGACRVLHSHRHKAHHSAPNYRSAVDVDPPLIALIS